MIFKHFFQQSLQFCCKWALIYASKIYSSDLFFNYGLFSQFGRKNLGVKTTFFLRNMVRNMVFRNMVKFFILDIYVIRAAFSDRDAQRVCFLSRLGMNGYGAHSDRNGAQEGIFLGSPGADRRPEVINWSSRSGGLGVYIDLGKCELSPRVKTSS